MSTIDWKERAIKQWTADPCGPEATSAHELVRGRREYAPWMSGALRYEDARELDVLDVGCGQGIDLIQYAMAGATVTGVDLTPRHVEIARAHLEELGLHGTVVLGDAEQMPFPDNSFDVVSSNGVLHHTPNMSAALREIHRVMRPGGRATILVYNRNSFHYWLHQVLYRGVMRGLIFKERGMAGVLSTGVERTSIAARPLVRVYNSRQVRRVLRDAGFENVATSVSPFRPLDSLFTRRLPESLPFGHGWYVVAKTMKPSPSSS